MLASRLFFGLSLALGACAATAAADDPLRVYIGTYTEGTKSEGIYMLTFDQQSGALGKLELVAKTVNPSFLAWDPKRPILYCVNEVSRRGDRPGGGVSSFAVEPVGGTLTPRDEQSSAGEAPCHLSVDPEGAAVLVANYASGHLAVLPIGADGRLERSIVQVRDQGSSVDRERQEGPHAHCVRFDPAGKWAVLADLGTDHVVVLDASQLQREKALIPRETFTLAPGTGPRHVAFARRGKTLYVLGELASTITVFDFDPETGTGRQVQSTSTLPVGTKVTNHTAEIVVHPSGNFVYASNRGHDSIAAFAIEAQSGKLTPIGHTPTGGKTPRNFNISPNGKFLIAANQDSSNLVVFRINAESGMLTPTGGSVVVPAPVCVLFDTLKQH